MNEIISSRVENDYLLIVGSGKINSDEEYQLQVKQYSEAIIKSGLCKAIIDEREVQYAPSLFLQMDIIRFYSSEELPKELKGWKIACVSPKDSILLFEFWADTARRNGYNHRAFASIEAAREFMLH